MRPAFVFSLTAVLLLLQLSLPSRALAAPAEDGTVQINLFERGTDDDSALPYASELDDFDSRGTTSLGFVVTRMLQIVVVIAALIVFVFLIWGAVDWITAGGDSGKISNARSKITQSFVGIVILGGIVAFYMALQQWLGFTVLRFNNEQQTEQRIPSTPPDRLNTRQLIE